MPMRDPCYLVLWRLLLLLLHQLCDCSQKAAVKISRGVMHVRVQLGRHADHFRDTGQYGSTWHNRSRWSRLQCDWRQGLFGTCNWQTHNITDTLLEFTNIWHCHMTNYELLRWLVETQSRDVGHNRTLHTWASDRETFFHSVAHVACVTFSHSVTHVARLFPYLAENENRINASNLRWVDLYWDNARMRMYGHDVQSINELFIAERNTN